VPVDRSYYRFATREDRERDLSAFVTVPGYGTCFAFSLGYVKGLSPKGKVCSRAKRLASARYHYRAHGVVTIEFVKDVSQFLAHLQGERVHVIGPM
jgi:pimeloyl-ACP methyl ester carboxylesterase